VLLIVGGRVRDVCACVRACVYVCVCVCVRMRVQATSKVRYMTGMLCFGLQHDSKFVSTNVF